MIHALITLSMSSTVPHIIVAIASLLVLINMLIILWITLLYSSFSLFALFDLPIEAELTSILLFLMLFLVIGPFDLPGMLKDIMLKMADLAEDNQLGSRVFRIMIDVGGGHHDLI